MDGWKKKIIVKKGKKPWLGNNNFDDLNINITDNNHITALTNAYEKGMLYPETQYDKDINFTLWWLGKDLNHLNQSESFKYSSWIIASLW